jgi:drug/metabolite transporter (DMT)-like permease
MEAWIAITIAAAFLQNLRSALQKHMKGRVSTSGATYARFCFAFPFAILYVGGLTGFGGFELPSPPPSFWLYATVGGAAQIFATALLVSLFSFRNFAVGTAYSKTETVQTAVIGIVILSDPLSAAAVAGILISLIGVFALSMARSPLDLKSLLFGCLSRTALIGIASGTFFGISAVSYRAASLSLGGEGVIVQAAFTLACVTVMQTLAMTLYLRLREPGQITAVIRTWRVALGVGVSGMLASACWFTAMTLQNAAYVRALGQVELVFTLAASYFFFRERPVMIEMIGIGLLIGGVVILLLGS